MHAEDTLLPGEERMLELSEGAEFFCAQGRVRLECGVALVMGAGRGWRAPQAMRVRVRALEPSRYRVIAAPAAKKKPRDAGLVPVQRWLRELTHARRAA